MQFVRILQRFPNLTIFYKDNRADILTLLRQASWLHGEPILAFIYPPVTECLQCEETLYFFARVSVTLYKVTVPIPG